MKLPDVPPALTTDASAAMCSRIASCAYSIICS